MPVVRPADSPPETVKLTLTIEFSEGLLEEFETELQNIADKIGSENHQADDDLGNILAANITRGPAMSVGKKAILGEIGFWCTSAACAVYWERVPSQGGLACKVWLSGFVVFAAWMSTLDCPRCGHNVTSRPLKWLHDFP